MRKLIIILKEIINLLVSLIDYVLFIDRRIGLSPLLFSPLSLLPVSSLSRSLLYLKLEPFVGNVFSPVSAFPPDTGHSILGGGLELCPPGSKIYKALATGCEMCPPGYYTIDYNQTECIGCPFGTYGGEGMDVCVRVRAWVRVRA